MHPSWEQSIGIGSIVNRLNRSSELEQDGGRIREGSARDSSNLKLVSKDERYYQ